MLPTICHLSYHSPSDQSQTMHTLVEIQTDRNVKMNDQRQEQMNQIKIMSHEYILLAHYIFSAKTSHEAKNGITQPPWLPRQWQSLVLLLQLLGSVHSCPPSSPCGPEKLRAQHTSSPCGPGREHGHVALDVKVFSILLQNWFVLTWLFPTGTRPLTISECFVANTDTARDTFWPEIFRDQIRIFRDHKKAQIRRQN